MPEAKHNPGGWLAGNFSVFFTAQGAALTLDEFALWLNLRDVYWAKEGRASLDAVVLFFALLLVGVSGAPLWRGLVRELGRHK